MVEQLRSREVGEGAERIARLTADKKKLEERLKVGRQQGKYVIHSCGSFKNKIISPRELVCAFSVRT